jgi:hypothetical protein
MSKKSAIKKGNQQESNAEKQDSPLSNVHVDNFDITKYSVNPIGEFGENGGSQYCAFPRYKYGVKKVQSGGRAQSDSDRFILITDPIKIGKGGLPKVDGNHRKTEAACQYFWCPLLDGDEAGQNLLKVLNEIDEFNDNKINVEKNKGFIVKTDEKTGKAVSLKSLKYSSCVKEFDPAQFNDEEADDEDENEDADETEGTKNKGKTTDKYKRLKVKIATVYDKNITDKDAEKEIKMKVYINDGNGNPKKKPENVTTMEQLRKLFTWNSVIQFAFEFNKFWVMKNLDENKVRKCSIGAKCIQIYISELAEYTSVSQELGSGVFGFRGGKNKQLTQGDDEDEVEGDGEEVEELGDGEEGDGEDGDGEEGDGEEGDEDADAEEEEPEPEPEPPKKGAKGKVATPAPVPAKGKGKVAKPEPEPEPEEEEEEPEEEEVEEEEPEPEPEPPKGKAGAKGKAVAPAKGGKVAGKTK